MIALTWIAAGIGLLFLVFLLFGFVDAGPLRGLAAAILRKIFPRFGGFK